MNYTIKLKGEELTPTEIEALGLEVEPIETNTKVDPWLKLGSIRGYFITATGEVLKTPNITTAKQSANGIYPTEELCKASIALAKLLHIRDSYREGWIQTENTLDNFHVIIIFSNWKVHSLQYRVNPFTFQSKEIAEQFLTDCEELLEQVKPLFIS